MHGMWLLATLAHALSLQIGVTALQVGGSIKCIRDSTTFISRHETSSIVLPSTGAVAQNIGWRIFIHGITGGSQLTTGKGHSEGSFRSLRFVVSSATIPSSRAASEI
jgi:hypothetical protein